MNPNLYAKYRFDSMRASWWDYNSPASYFITICVRNKACDFGEISNACMLRTEPGRIAEEIWHQIPKQFEKANLGEFVLMPNHIHGIIHISDNSSSDIKQNDMHGVETPIYRVSTPAVSTSVSTSDSTSDSMLVSALVSPPVPLPTTIDPGTDRGGFSRAKNPMFYENLGRIMRWFKGRSTYEIRKVVEEFHWQRNYHDHIIQNESSLHLIETYIRTNPLRWKKE